MTPYDVAMIVAVVGGMFWGAWKGITWQVATIASLVLGYVGAMPISARIAPSIPLEPLVARGIAMVISYVLVSLGVFLVAWSIRATLRRWKFEAYDRHLGMLLGGLEGAMAGLIATVMALSVVPQWREPIVNSPTGHVVDRLLEAAKPALPSELRERLEPFWRVLETPGSAGGSLVDEAGGMGKELIGGLREDVEKSVDRRVESGLEAIEDLAEEVAKGDGRGRSRNPGRR